MATITAVDECVFPTADAAGFYDHYIGVRLVAGDATVQVAISNYQSCCEHYGINIYNEGVLSSIDALRELYGFVGARSSMWGSFAAQSEPPAPRRG